jgi:nucleotide-binding universal stress UspA family protein
VIRRVLVAVNDSSPSLAAMRFGIGLATSVGGELGVVTVVDADQDAGPILRHVVAMAAEAGQQPTVMTVRDGGAAFEAILAEASAWDADVIVVGRSDHRPTGRPFVGTQAEHVLEFSELPVVVVPDRRHGGGEGT